MDVGEDSDRHAIQRSAGICHGADISPALLRIACPILSVGALFSALRNTIGRVILPSFSPRSLAFSNHKKLTFNVTVSIVWTCWVFPHQRVRHVDIPPWLRTTMSFSDLPEDVVLDVLCVCEVSSVISISQVRPVP